MAIPVRMRGFTLIELVITLALVGLVAMVALPLYEVTSTRMKEAELRQALRVIRAGIDTYKAAVDSGQIRKSAEDSGYPPSLETLTQTLEIQTRRDFGLNAAPTTRHLIILRRLPRDPFHPDPTVPAEQTWNTRSYASKADDPQPGADVFDLSSRSTRKALDGTLYSSW